MQLKLFVIPIKNMAGAEAGMNGFLRGHRVLAVRKEFVANGENSFWSFCVEYLEGTAAATGSGAPGNRVPKMDYGLRGDVDAGGIPDIQPTAGLA